MKFLKIAIVLSCVIFLNSCASGYKTINPSSLNYLSNNISNGVELEYKYNLLGKKYSKKELKKDIKLIAIKLTNNTDTDLAFGKDIKLTYSNGNDLVIMDNEKVFTYLKQQPATYLLFLLLTPLNLYTTNGSETTSSTPIGLVLGPGLAGGNMIVASSANKKFKTDLLNYNINGATIKKGETIYGLIGVRSNNYEAIKASLNE